MKKRFIHLFCIFIFSFFSLIGYPTYKEIQIDSNKFCSFPESCGHGAYLDPSVTEKIDKTKVKSIFEIGSRDALDAIRLSEHYESHVYAFECNPECIIVCKHNVSLTPNVSLVEKAVWDKEDMIEFYPIIPDAGKIRDPGSSSCFQLTSEKQKLYTQTVIKVPSIRLDNWMREQKICKVDLICMDTQGATLKILQGMGDLIKNTKYIVTECEVKPTYEGENLLPELVSFLQSKGFELVPTQMTWDYLFVNKAI